MRLVPAFLAPLFTSALLFAAEGDPLGEEVHHKKEGPEGLVLDATSVVASCAHGTAECKPAAKKDLQTRAQTFSKSATEAEWDPLRRLCTVLVRFQGAAGDPIVVAGKACVAKLAVLGGPRAGALVQAGKVQEALDFADSIASDFGDPAVKHIDAAITKGRYALCADAEKKAVAACSEGPKSICADRARKAKKDCDAELKPGK
jgi:hypothetical protein